MPHYTRLIKNATRICRTQCQRKQIPFALNLTSYNKLMDKHPWCNRYCKEFCMSSVVDDCIREPITFCAQNCTTTCYHTGGPAPITYKPVESVDLETPHPDSRS